MDKKITVDLTDPKAEPTLEDFKFLCRAAGEAVRAESAKMDELAKNQGLPENRV